MRKLLMILMVAFVLGSSAGLLKAAQVELTEKQQLKMRHKMEMQSLKQRQKYQQQAWKGQDVPRAEKARMKHQMKREMRELRERQEDERQDRKDRQRLMKESQGR